MSISISRFSFFYPIVAVAFGLVTLSLLSGCADNHPASTGGAADSASSDSQSEAEEPQSSRDQAEYDPTTWPLHGNEVLLDSAQGSEPTTKTFQVDQDTALNRGEDGELSMYGQCLAGVAVTATVRDSEGAEMDQWDLACEEIPEHRSLLFNPQKEKIATIELSIEGQGSWAFLYAHDSDTE